jgi:hypothetical protein
MLRTLVLSPIISGPIWPGLLLALTVCILLPGVGLVLLVRGIWSMSKEERSASWIIMGLGCLLLSGLLFWCLYY